MKIENVIIELIIMSVNMYGVLGETHDEKEAKILSRQIEALDRAINSLQANNSGGVFTVDIKDFEKWLDYYIDPYEISGALESLRFAAREYEERISSKICQGVDSECMK